MRRAEAASKDGDPGAALHEEVTRRVRAAVALRPEVEFVPSGALYDEHSIKVKRVLDLRTRA